MVGETVGQTVGQTDGKMGRQSDLLVNKSKINDLFHRNYKQIRILDTKCTGHSKNSRQILLIWQLGKFPSGFKAYPAN
jgi:hypothetical protein